MYIHVCAYMCTFFLVVAFHDARFLSGLYHRFSYIVIAFSTARSTRSSREAQELPPLETPLSSVLDVWLLLLGASLAADERWLTGDLKLSCPWRSVACCSFASCVPFPSPGGAFGGMVPAAGAVGKSILQVGNSYYNL